MPPASTLAPLALVVLFSFAVEAALGFGATVLCVSLGSFLLPTGPLLYSFVPLNLALSLWLAARNARAVDARALARYVLPAMGLGLPVGLYALRYLPETQLRLLFALFVLALSALELRAAARPRAAPAPEEPGAKPEVTLPMLALLCLGGAIHGAFATGGPLVVYVLGRTLGHDKARFRATLSALWLLLNLAVVASWLATGQLTRAALPLTAALALPLALGLALGEWAHRRVPERLFRPGVFALLAVAASILLARSALALLR